MPRVPYIPDSWFTSTGMKTLEHEVAPLSQRGDTRSREIEYIVRFYDRPRRAGATGERLEQNRDLIVWWYLQGAVYFDSPADASNRWTGIPDDWDGIPKWWGPTNDRHLGRRLPLQSIRVERLNDRMLTEDVLGYFDDPRYRTWYSTHPIPPGMTQSEYLEELRSKPMPLMPPETWRATAVYSEPNRSGGSGQEQVAFRRSFSMSTQNQRVYWTKYDSDLYVKDGNALLLSKFNPTKNLLNVDMRGRPSGADTFITEGSYSMTWEDVSWAASDMRTALAYGGCVNSTIFEGFNPGEVLFSGMSAELIYNDGGTTDPSGQRNGTYEGTVTLEFTVRRNQTITAGSMGNGVPPGDVIAQGWDIVHPRYIPTARGAELVGIVVSQVMPEINFYNFLPTGTVPRLKVI